MQSPKPMEKLKNKSGADSPRQTGGMSSEPSVPLMDRYSESSKIAKIFDYLGSESSKTGHEKIRI